MFDDATECLIISIEGQENRLRTVRERLRSYGVKNPLLHLDGVLGKRLTLEERTKQCSTACAWTCPFSELGTTLSHIKAWKVAAESEKPCTVIFEDDVVFRSTWDAKKVWKHLQKVVNSAGPFDVFQLGWYGDADPKESDWTWTSWLFRAAQSVASVADEDVDLADGDAFRPKRFHGLHAYVVTREGAKRLLEALPKATGAPDIMVSNANANDQVRVVCSRPSLIRQDELGSSQTSNRLNLLSWALQGKAEPSHKAVDDQRPTDYIVKFGYLRLGTYNVAFWQTAIAVGALGVGFLFDNIMLAFLVGFMVVGALVVVDSWWDQNLSWSDFLVESVFFGGSAMALGSVMRRQITEWTKPRGASV